MPSGRVHTAISTVSGAAAAGTVYWLGFGPASALAAFIGCAVVGTILSPDLDVDAGNVSDKHMRRFMLGSLWSVFWSPYRKNIKHRSTLSHAPVIGTGLRLLYILFPPVVLLIKDQEAPMLETGFRATVSMLLSGLFVWLLLLALFFNVLSLPTAAQQLLPFVVIGLLLSDVMHFVADSIT